MIFFGGKTMAKPNLWMPHYISYESQQNDSQILKHKKDCQRHYGDGLQRISDICPVKQRSFYTFSA